MIEQVDSIATPATAPVDAIERAVEMLDYVRAAVMACERARAGEDVPAEMVAQILPGIRDFTLAACLCVIGTGDRAAALIGCVRARRFPANAEASPIEALVLYAAWRAGVRPARIAPEARRLARMQVSDLGYQFIHTIAKWLGDDNLANATRHFRIAPVRTGSGFLHTLDTLLASPRDAIYDALPADVLARRVAKHTIRIAPRVGRNDPCPCGSGLKYKRCHAGKEPQATPSPVAGLSWDEYVTTAGDKMSVDDVHKLPLPDLARVDPATLGDLPLAATVRRFTSERLFERAAGCAAVLDGRGGDRVDTIDGLRDEIIAEALAAGDLETADAQLGLMKDPAKAGLHRLEVDIRVGRANTLEALAKAAEHALGDDSAPAGVELAHALLRATPGLGVLVARGCLRAGRAAVSEGLLAGIEEARDALNLPPGDPAWDVRAALDSDDEIEPVDIEAQRAAAEANELRGSLRDASSRLHGLEQQLAAKQAELEAARHPGSAQPVAADPGDRERERSLRVKVEELGGLVRAGNAERTELRRRLAASSSSTSVRPEPASPATAPPPRDREDSDDDVSEHIEEVERKVSIPALGRNVRDALDEVPNAVAAEALRTIGALAAGDAGAWRRVKQAKDMPKQVLMARIGIHYRLLFRVEERAMDVFELIQRGSLLPTLKRMRNTKT